MRVLHLRGGREPGSISPLTLSLLLFRLRPFSRISHDVSTTVETRWRLAESSSRNSDRRLQVRANAGEYGLSGLVGSEAGDGGAELGVTEAGRVAIWMLGRVGLVVTQDGDIVERRCWRMFLVSETSRNSSNDISTEVETSPRDATALGREVPDAGLATDTGTHDESSWRVANGNGAGGGRLWVRQAGRDVFWLLGAVVFCARRKGGGGGLISSNAVVGGCFSCPKLLETPRMTSLPK
jgi:hypothetical protein